MKDRRVCKDTTAPMRVLSSDTSDGEPARSTWDEARVFHEGDRFFDELEGEIRKAARSVFLESYIFATDRVGQRVLSVLAQAVARGVDVRVIVDGIGSGSWLSDLRRKTGESGIALKVFHEPPWVRWWRRATEGRRPQRVGGGRFFQRINRRDHRKVCIIDEAVAFAGSMNVIDYHLRSMVGAAAWRDTGVRVRGAEVAVLVESFNDLWLGKRRALSLGRRERARRRRSGELVRLNARRRERRENYLDLLVRIVGSERRVWIENAYFVPDGSLLRVLRVAAEAGVDVKIVVPAFSDVVFIPWVASAFHLGLLTAGVRVFEYTKSVLHAKTMLIDDWGLVGSSNLNHRSLLHDLEVDIVVADPTACAQLERQFVVDCGDCVEITLENWRHRPLGERLVGRLLLAVRHWL